MTETPLSAAPAVRERPSGTVALSSSVWLRFEAWARKIERHRLFVLALLAALYAIHIVRPIQRPLWYDELITYHVAQSSSLAQFFGAMRHVDLTPPLLFGLVRLSQELFGANEVATRLPSAVCFFLGNVAIFYFLERRAGALWSAAALLLFWTTPWFRFASEARPYGLLLGFFSLTLLAYDTVIHADPGRRRRLGVAGVALGTTGMMLSHVLAPISILPFFAAELIRSLRARRIDWTLGACLGLPVLGSLACLPLILHSQQVLFPAAFQASVSKMIDFYRNAAVIYVFPVFPLAAILALGLAFFINRARVGQLGSSHRRIVDWGGFVPASVLLAGPVLVNLAFMRNRTAFWERYCLTSALAITVLEIMGVAMFTRFSRGAALMAIGVFVGTLLPGASAAAKPRVLFENIQPDLPFVTASALTFFEMDHYEKASFLPRVYYLLDRESAIRYAHATLFEGMSEVPKYLPIRAHVASWSAFTAVHRHFLVFGDVDYPEDWLLRKLLAEGASVKLVQRVSSQYKDTAIYDVVLQP